MKYKIQIATLVLAILLICGLPTTIGATENQILTSESPNTQQEIIDENELVDENVDLSKDIETENTVDNSPDNQETQRFIEVESNDTNENEVVNEKVDGKILTEDQSQEQISISEEDEEHTYLIIQSQINNTTELNVGVENDRVIDLREKLNVLGFASSEKKENYFGESTKKAVERLQKYYGLPITGIADQHTLDSIQEILSNSHIHGDSNEEIKQIKEELSNIGYASFKNPNGYYGSSTQKAIKAFQRDHGLLENGIIDSKTRSKIKEVANGPLKYGMRRADTRELKENLTKLAFASFKNPNNYFGISTERALKEFQKYHGISATGEVDEETIKTIHEVLTSPLQYGKRYDDTKKVKEELTIIGFASFKNPNDYFGNSTKRAVKAFQKANGLPQSGIVDAKTRSKITEVANGPLKHGMRRADAKELKENLTKLDFASFNNPNNYFGRSTERALKKFQKYYGLSATGKADDVTLKAMNEVLTSPLQNGKSHHDTKKIKEELTIIGIASFKNPNDYFGASTEKAVKAFQKAYELPQTGIVDTKTRSKITEVANGPLKYGMRRADAKELKENLTKLDFASFKNPNNFFGRSTEKALKEFQKYFGISATGKVDKVTVRKINEILTSPFQYGKSHADTKKIKQDLTKLGFASFKNPNDYFGNGAKSAVLKFQNHYGLKENGIVDSVTKKKMSEILSSSYQFGKSNKKIKEVKQKLTTLGFATFKNPNGYFGSSTEKAIKKFQKKYKLPVNGIMDDIVLSKLENAYKNRKILKIFIDPGHGGKDSGATGYGLQEKAVVLDIGRKAANYLTSKFVGVEVMLSRTTDRFIELEDRAKMANDWGADYFISLHTNAFYGRAKGFETFIHNGKVTKETKNRQKDIHKYLSDRIDVNDRGKKQANYSVLRNTNMPSVLIEYMFIDNRSENNKLKSSSYRDFLGRITAEAIANSFKLKVK